MVKVILGSTVGRRADSKSFQNLRFLNLYGKKMLAHWREQEKRLDRLAAERSRKQMEMQRLASVAGSTRTATLVQPPER